MEQLTSLSWNDLTPEHAAAFTFSEDFRRAIPAATLDVTVEPSTDKPEARRIGIKIDFPSPAGQPVRAICLTSWIYRIEPAAEAPQVEQP